MELDTGWLESRRWMAGVLGVEKLSNTTRISHTHWHRLADGVEAPLELDGPVAGGEFVEDQPACQIECRVQPDGAVTDAVMGAPFGCAYRSGKIGWVRSRAWT